MDLMIIRHTEQACSQAQELKELTQN